MPAGLVIAAAAADRLRGAAFGIGKTPELLLYGWIVAAMLGHPLDQFTLVLAALFAAGGSFGWGEPIGAGLFGFRMRDQHLEKWQVGPLRERTYLALTARGIMWGAPLLLALPWVPSAWTVMAAYTIAFPAAVLLASRLPRWRWEAQELIRGALAAIIVISMQRL